MNYNLKHPIEFIISKVCYGRIWAAWMCLTAKSIALETSDSRLRYERLPYNGNHRGFFLNTDSGDFRRRSKIEVPKPYDIKESE